jgi:hypothetical protein
MSWLILGHRTCFCPRHGRNDWDHWTQPEQSSWKQSRNRESRGEVCGSIRIQIEGFRPIFNEVAFVEMKPADGEYEPLIGHIILEQSQAAVDMLGHRLVSIKYMDLK